MQRGRSQPGTASLPYISACGRSLTNCCRHSLRGSDAVHRRRGDASGIARPLAAGEKAPQGGLAALVPEDTHRGGGAGLDAGEDSAAVGKAVELPVKKGQGGAEGGGDIFRQTLVQIGGGNARAVGGRNAPHGRRGPA